MKEHDDDAPSGYSMSYGKLTIFISYMFFFSLHQDLDALLNNSWPEFTLCFQYSVIVWIPCGWIWLTFPLYLVYLCFYVNTVSVPLNKLNLSKTVCPFSQSAFDMILCMEEQSIGVT